MKTIQEYISQMLLENTGKHFMDSGGENGRMWQRNQGKNFEAEPRVSFEIWNGELDATVSTYHYLCEVLSVDATSETLNEVIKANECHWTEDAMDKVTDYLEETLCGEAENVSEVWNTYNGENNLSQILLFQTFTIEGEAYVLLQIHGGADVRCGYTDTKCFKLEGYLTGFVDMHGSINDVQIDNYYNGYCLTWSGDDGEHAQGEDIELDKDKEYDISLDFYVMDDTYMYCN